MKFTKTTPLSPFKNWNKLPKILTNTVTNLPSKFCRKDMHTKFFSGKLIESRHLAAPKGERVYSENEIVRLRKTWN
jgi:hypothetical protein